MTGDPYSEDPDYLFADKWKRLYDLGLGFSHHCQVIRQIEHGVEETVEQRDENGKVCTVRRKHTPVGTLQQTNARGEDTEWVTEHWIKTPGDYRTMQWIVEHTELATTYDEYDKQLQRIGDYGVIVLLASRTPAMSISIDWAGMETFCTDLALEVPELFDLYDARRKFFLEEARLIAAGPGRFVKWPENLTAAMLGPQRYDDLLCSIYREAIPIMEAGDKRVMVHYDGALAGVAEQIASAPFHILESLTEPPEGDMTYDQCRKAWPGKTFWANINQGLFALPEAELRQAVVERRRRAGKEAFAFEIYEYRPPNWEETIPVILDALRALD